jgi:hypothetical protein
MARKDCVCLAMRWTILIHDLCIVVVQRSWMTTDKELQPSTQDIREISSEDFFRIFIYLCIHIRDEISGMSTQEGGHQTRIGISSIGPLIEIVITYGIIRCHDHKHVLRKFSREYLSIPSSVVWRHCRCYPRKF